MPEQPKKEPLPPILQLLTIVNRLIIKANETKTQQELIFTILNDTVHLIHYDQAFLWDLQSEHPYLLGVSGQPTLNRQTEVVKDLTLLVEKIKNREEPQQLKIDSFSSQQETWKEREEKSPQSLTLWLPIYSEGKLSLGLWLERWQMTEQDLPSNDVLNLLTHFLIPGYGVAWSKFKPQWRLKKLGLKKKHWGLLALTLFLLLFGIRVPLRVVAPCEVVPKDPYLVTAPLEGIIEEVVVRPGQMVRNGDILFEYNKQVTTQELKVAQKEVAIMESEVNRAATLGLKDENSLTELAILKLKLEKEKVQLGLAEYHASLLTVISPVPGIVMIDNPDGWRGKPVKVGEKVLTISDPRKTKVRIWLPESDNIPIDPDQSIKVFLNISPEESHLATLLYIANEATLSDKQVVSFVTEADWKNPDKNTKLGLKGTAVLYGERVSLFYYILRKPWSSIRQFFGI